MLEMVPEEQYSAMAKPEIITLESEYCRNVNKASPLESLLKVPEAEGSSVVVTVVVISLAPGAVKPLSY